VALQLDSPTVSALLDLLGQPDPGEGPEVLPDSITEEEAENYRAEMARLRETELRRAEFVRSAIRIVADGLTSVAWQVAGGSEGFETRTHVAGIDASRLGMWRELSQMFFDILTAAVRTDTLPSDDGSAAEFVRSVRIDETDDGYVIVRHTRHQTIARLLTEMLPGPAGTVFEEVRPPVPEPVPEAIELMHTAIADGTPAEIIGAVEPNLELVRSWMNPYDQHTFVTALINAYGVRGRYDEAAALVDQSLEAARASSTEDQDAMWRSQAAHATVCPMPPPRVSCTSRKGMPSARSRPRRRRTPTSERTCSQQSFPVSSCAACGAGGARPGGRGPRAARQRTSPTDTLEFLVARVRVLVLGGRVEQAHALARDVCIGGPEWWPLRLGPGRPGREPGPRRRELGRRRAHLHGRGDPPGSHRRTEPPRPSPFRGGQLCGARAARRSSRGHAHGVCGGPRERHGLPRREPRPGGGRPFVLRACARACPHAQRGGGPARRGAAHHRRPWATAPAARASGALTLSRCSRSAIGCGS
jgi:hypothetical protein